MLSRTMDTMTTPSLPLLFLPGAVGHTTFWHPVAEQLTYAGRRTFLSYPGFGGVPADPAVQSMEDLLTRVLRALPEPSHVIAQSMGGVLALRAALREPTRVRSLVLSATSGGLNTQALGAQDWRPWFAANFPELPNWFARDRSDLTAELARIDVPVLLIWGDADPISPVTVGERLAALLPNATLHVIAGGDHDVANAHASEVARYVDAHLMRVR
jgi:poly(3-hydroxyoctanoate) depolymerase